MTKSLTSDDLQALAAFPFKDAGWKNKFLIGSLLVFFGYIIPLIPMLPVYGYCAQMMRRIIVEDGEPFLPAWDDFGKLFGDGFKLFVAALVYSLPVIALMMFSYALLFSTLFVTPFIAGAGESANETPSPLAGLIVMIGSLGFFILFGLAMVLILVLGSILPAMWGHIIATDELAAAFRWREWWAIFRANWGGFLLAYALLIAFWMVSSFALQIIYLTIIGCCFLPFILPPLTLYSLLVASPLFAWAYRDGRAKVGQATSLNSEAIP